ncbi:reverse transcriptase domain-containing protein [Tanacetum coccineum]
MFNSTLTGNTRVWFDDLSPESVDSYDDLKKAFFENYLQQKKCIKDSIEIHNIKQREGESTKDFVKRYKLESRDVKRAPEYMRISGFIHGITNPELIKRLHDKISKTVDEMMRVTTYFVRGEVAASNHERKKMFPPWKQHEGSQKQNFKKGDECMHLKKQIEEMLKAGKLSHLIKELKQNNGKEQPKVAKKGETSGKEKALLQRNLDIFARKPTDMTGVPRHIAEHRLNVREGCSPVRQKKQGQAADRNQAIQEEVGKLVKAGIMREVHYHDWLSNSVMVKKHDDSWRMCVDFKDLNKACPKDGYLLPEIDWKVESLCGFPFKCFLDAYKGYHQIQMAKEDEEKTAFITSQGIF